MCDLRHGVSEEGGRHAPRAWRMMRQPSAAFSDGGGQCGEYLFQFSVRPSVDRQERSEKRILTFIPETRFRNPGSKEYNRSNEK
jgi:hypothetical protein